MLNRLLVNYQEEDALQILLARTKYEAHEILKSHPVTYLRETNDWAEEKFKELTEKR